MVLACGGDGNGDTTEDIDGGSNAQSTATTVEGTADAGTPGGAVTPTIDELVVQALLTAHANLPSQPVDGYVRGAADAPLTLTVYEDFQCPHCLGYTAAIEPFLVQQYVSAGSLRVEFQSFPILGPESVAAGVAAECAAQQNRFWDMHHALFLLQARAGQVSDEQLNIGRFSDAALAGIAQDLGLDMDEFGACYANAETLETVQDMAAAARAAGLTGTPGFLLDGGPIPGGAPATAEDWANLIEAELDRVAEEGS